MSDKRALIDTNVLIYAVDPKSSKYAASRALVETAANESADLCLSSQILAEFFSIVTDRRRVPEPRTPAEAVEAIDRFMALPGIFVLPTPMDLVSRWSSLVVRHQITAQRVYDAQLAATMLGNGVRRVYTYNVADFESFEEIEVIVPS